MENSQMPKKPLPTSRQSATRHTGTSPVLGGWVNHIVRVFSACLIITAAVGSVADITPSGDEVAAFLMPDIAGPNNTLGPLGASTSEIILEPNSYVGLGADSTLVINLGSRLVADAIGAHPFDAGPFTIEVTQGGLLEVVSINAADDANASTGTILVDGDGSQISVQDDFFVGSGFDDGNLTISNGGLVQINQTGAFAAINGGKDYQDTAGVFVGVDGAVGDLFIDNAALVMEVIDWSGDSLILAAGLDGTGSINVSNGSTVSITDLTPDGVDYILLGQSGDDPGWGASPANGSMIIEGAGTSVSITTFDGGIDIANSFVDGSGDVIGTLDVLAGATVDINATATGGIVIGRGLGADGSMTISGPGSTVDVNGGIALVLIGTQAQAEDEELLMPGNGRGSLTVSNQGQLNVSGDEPDLTLFVIGQGAGDGEVLVDTGGMIDIDGLLQVSTPFVATFLGNDILGSDTQTGLLTINDTGVVNSLSTVVDDRGTISGTGTLATGLLRVQTGGLVNLTHLSGVVATDIVGGLIDVPNDLFLGLPLGQSLDVHSGNLQVDGELVVGALDAPAIMLIDRDSETGVVDATTTTVGNMGTVWGGGTLRTDLLTVETGGLVQLGNLGLVSAIDVAGGQLDMGTDLFLGAGLPQTMAVNDGGIANITGTLFLGGEAPATLGGDGGSVIANAVVVNSNGVIGPGNSVGTLDIFGDLTLGGGELLFEIAGTDPGQYDILNVNGDVALDSGTLRFLPIDGFSPTGAADLEVLFATGTLGLDPGVQILGDGLGPDFMFTVGSGANGNVGTVEFLAMDIGPVVDDDDDDPPPVADGDDIAPVTGPNQNRQRMANYLDDLCPRVESLSSPSSDEADLDQRCGNLRNVGTTSSQVMTALDAISPDDIINNVSSVLRFAPTQHGTLTRRLNGLRSGSSRINVTGLNIETEDVRLEGEDLQKALEALTDGEFGRWGFFTDGRMNFGSHEATDRVPGFDFDTISATVGTDYRLRPNAYLGAALSYNEADADFDAGGGTTLKTTTLSAFATYFRESAFYADVMISYGMGDLDTARDVMYEDAGGILFRQARGTTDGEQLSAGAGTGFDFSANQWVFGPHLGLYYSDLHARCVRGDGGGRLELRLPRAESEVVHCQCWRARLTFVYARLGCICAVCTCGLRARV